VFTLKKINIMKYGRSETHRRTVSVGADAASALQTAMDAQISDDAVCDEEWLRREGASRVKGNQTRMQTGGCSQNRNQEWRNCKKPALKASERESVV